MLSKCSKILVNHSLTLLWIVELLDPTISVWTPSHCDVVCVLKVIFGRRSNRKGPRRTPCNCSLKIISSDDIIAVIWISFKLTGSLNNLQVSSTANYLTEKKWASFIVPFENHHMPSSSQLHSLISQTIIFFDWLLSYTCPFWQLHLLSPGHWHS